MYGNRNSVSLCDVRELLSSSAVSVGRWVSECLDLMLVSNVLIGKLVRERKHLRDGHDQPCELLNQCMSVRRIAIHCNCIVDHVPYN